MQELNNFPSLSRVRGCCRTRNALGRHSRESGNPSSQEFTAFNKLDHYWVLGYFKLIKLYVWTPCLRVGVMRNCVVR